MEEADATGTTRFICSATDRFLALLAASWCAARPRSSRSAHVAFATQAGKRPRCFHQSSISRASSRYLSSLRGSSPACRAPSDRRASQHGKRMVSAALQAWPRALHQSRGAGTAHRTRRCGRRRRRTCAAAPHHCKISHLERFACGQPGLCSTGGLRTALPHLWPPA